MQPYQKISGEMNRQSELPKEYLKKGLSLATSLGGASILSKVAPFLSQ